MKTQNLHSVSGFVLKNIKVIDGKSTRVAKFTICHSMGKDNDPLYLDITAFESERQPLPLDIIKEHTPVLVTYRVAPNNFEKDGKKFYRTQNVMTGIEVIPTSDADAPAENDAPSEFNEEEAEQNEAPKAKPVAKKTSSSRKNGKK